MVSAANSEAMKRVTRGAKSSPTENAATTQRSRQKGQIRSSPIALRRPVPREVSSSSAGPPLPSSSVKGARSGLVTLSLAISRLSLCEAVPTSSSCPGSTFAGSSRSLRLASARAAPTSEAKMLMKAR